MEGAWLVGDGIRLEPVNRNIGDEFDACDNIFIMTVLYVTFISINF